MPCRMKEALGKVGVVVAEHACLPLPPQSNRAAANMEKVGSEAEDKVSLNIPCLGSGNACTWLPEPSACRVWPLLPGTSAGA